MVMVDLVLVFCATPSWSPLARIYQSLPTLLCVELRAVSEAMLQHTKVVSLNLNMEMM